MNVERAIHSHAAWTARLIAYLAKPNRSLDPGKLEGHGRCELGQWIQEQGGKFAADAAFADLKREHENFHRAAAEVVRRASSGKAVSARISLGAQSAYASALFKMEQALFQLNENILKEAANRHTWRRSALTSFHPFESQR